ncbi:phosphatase PAP2 family protein [Acetonema longum]|uniref:Lipid A 1-phosphatase n=1 Tax=Acetonema longum DSM 6540 TaxID=1009370 RepID=F7NG65_9FIRM|nr:phosphatase PAP2 family protein [Acetonema longum]EGO64983.1 lipid A 1-phosphatase [Acetonema longum DSM 6540]
MLQEYQFYGKPKRYIFAVTVGIAVGLATILHVLLFGQGDNELVTEAALMIGLQGNDIFLWSTNLYLLYWAYRRGIKSVIPLTLWLNFFIWVCVQGFKLIALGIQTMGWASLAWTLRPTGEAMGFPSGHAAHAFAMALVLTCFYPRWTWLWYTCAAAISWSRVESSAHTDLQVVVGTIAGLIIAWVMMVRWLRENDAQKAGLFDESATALPVGTNRLKRAAPLSLE